MGTLHLPDARHGATMAGQAALSRGMGEEPEIFFLTEGPTLPDLLGEEDWARVTASAATRGMPAFLVAKFHPDPAPV